MWLGVLHHVCDEHEWLGGKCTHENIVDSDKTPLLRESKAMESLRNVVLDKALLDSLQYYTGFR